MAAPEQDERFVDRLSRQGEEALGKVAEELIAKALDFPLVTLVGVILADVGLNLPDFRAAERTRAGRLRVRVHPISLEAAAVRHVDVVQLQPRVVIVVVITASGSVAKRTVDFEDVSLARGEGPALGNAPGVALAGSALWLPEPLLRRLRDEVSDGLRVASFGADALRRTAEAGDQRGAETLLIDAAHAAMEKGGPRAAVALHVSAAELKRSLKLAPHRRIGRVELPLLAELGDPSSLLGLVAHVAVENRQQKLLVLAIDRVLQALLEAQPRHVAGAFVDERELAQLLGRIGISRSDISYQSVLFASTPSWRLIWESVLP